MLLSRFISSTSSSLLLLCLIVCPLPCILLVSLSYPCSSLVVPVPCTVHHTVFPLSFTPICCSAASVLYVSHSLSFVYNHTSHSFILSFPVAVISSFHLPHIFLTSRSDRLLPHFLISSSAHFYGYGTWTFVRRVGRSCRCPNIHSGEGRRSRENKPVVGYPTS